MPAVSRSKYRRAYLAYVSNDVVARCGSPYGASHNVPTACHHREAEMNSNLQFALAKDHQRDLLRQAADARPVPETRIEGSATFASTTRSAWLRTWQLATHLARVSALTAPATLAVDSETVHLVR